MTKLLGVHNEWDIFLKDDDIIAQNEVTLWSYQACCSLHQNATQVPISTCALTTTCICHHWGHNEHERRASLHTHCTSRSHDLCHLPSSSGHGENTLLLWDLLKVPWWPTEQENKSKLLNTYAWKTDVTCSEFKCHHMLIIEV